MANDVARIGLLQQLCLTKLLRQAYSTCSGSVSDEAHRWNANPKIAMRHNDVPGYILPHFNPWLKVNNSSMLYRCYMFFSTFCVLRVVFAWE